MDTAIRRISRLIGLGAVIGTALVDYALLGWWRSRQRLPRYRALWLARYSRLTLRVFGIQVAVEGQVQPVPMSVYNHLSYLDILVLASVSPTLFVAKADVSGWPLFGRLAQCAGTIFVQRENRGHVRTVAQQLQTMAGGMPVVLFPEGTSSDGSEILPFHSSLLAPAAGELWPVQPGYLKYTVPDGDARHDLCWWGDMTLVPHIMRLAGLTGAQVSVRLGEPIQNADRKQLARELHQAVSALASRRVVQPPAVSLSQQKELEFAMSSLQ